MNRKQFITSIIILAVGSVILIITNAIFNYNQSWLLVMIVPLLGYLFIKYRVDGGVQYFSTRFNMLLDYDLDVVQALEIAQNGLKNAPTEGLKSMYQMYVGMALYYNGEYDEAIKTFNLIDLNRINLVFHTLIFTFTAYCAFEISDIVTFDQALDRLKNIKTRVPAKYGTFVENYEEILDAIKNMDVSIDHYKEVIDKHFSEDNGYVSRKLNYNYRLAYYYKAVGDIEAMDKCLAFVIANGKQQHLVKRAELMFQHSVKVEDYLERIGESKTEPDNLIEQ